MSKEPNHRTFSLGVVLSAATGRLLCDMGDVHAILNHVTGDNLFTHALPRAFRFASPLILAQYPEIEYAGNPEMLLKLDALIVDAQSEGWPNAVAMWFAWLRKHWGLAMEYPIASHADAWLQLAPIEELVGMVGKERMTIVEGVS